ncbi:MAG: CocE/NonD family hydrolase [Solirubrobacteraceae bacterium]
MRDGTVLKATVYRPEGPGPWPTLLARTPYGKDLPGAISWLDPIRATREGFMVVIQDTRGRFASDGNWMPFQYETQDGYDTVQWAAQLPGSNGRVGMFGLSYWGNTQWLAAIAQPPSLGAIAPALTWSDPDDGAFTRGGALELAVGLVWALEQGLDYVARQVAPAEEISRRVHDLIQELDHLAERGFWELPVFDSALLRRHRVPDLGSIAALSDPTVADRCRIAGRHDQVQVPVLNIGGWHDGFLQGVLDNHIALQSLGRDSRLIIGPWSHANFSETIGDLYFGLNARKDGGPAPAAGPGKDITALQLDWFRRRLTSDARSPEPQPVRIFVTGSNRWREYQCWPPQGTVEQRWYLHSGRRLSPAGPEDLDAVDQFIYDPANPVPTAGGQTLDSPLCPAGPVDQRSVEARPDVVVFTSQPLASDLEVTGRVRVMLHADSSARSTDWVARLCDVHPDGGSFSLCDGILRVADDARQPRRYEIDLWSISHVFGRGHRLRVDVTSSSFPRWDRNLNTGNQKMTLHTPARQRIHHDASHPSWLQLQLRGHEA